MQSSSGIVERLDVTFLLQTRSAICNIFAHTYTTNETQLPIVCTQLHLDVVLLGRVDAAYMDRQLHSLRTQGKKVSTLGCVTYTCTNKSNRGSADCTGHLNTKVFTSSLVELVRTKLSAEQHFIQYE